MSWLLLIVAVMANVTSNAMFKTAMQALPAERDVLTLLRFGLNPHLWIGFMACGVLLACYLLALRSMGLMVSYTFVISLSLVGISLVSTLLLHEPLSWRAAAGMALVVAGVAMLTMSQPAAA